MQVRRRLPALRALLSMRGLQISIVDAINLSFVWQRHAKRLARSGQIKEIAGAFLRPRRELTFEESMQTYEVGACDFCVCTLYDCVGANSRRYYCAPRSWQKSCSRGRVLITQMPPLARTLSGV